MSKYPRFFPDQEVCATQNGELHHFVIWEHGRHKQDEIIRDIQQHFTILDCFDIQWDQDTVTKSFSRLYGQSDSSGVRRLHERGGGRFLLITVWDENPVYDIAEAFSGHEVVNTNMLNLKKKYRGWVNRKKGNCIHSSTRPVETNHDLTLLLGTNTADYLDTVKQPWDGQFKQLNQNMLGAKGWKDIEETFYALNNTVNYAVLRNFEELPAFPDPEQHKDVDLLTSDKTKFLSILNPEGNFWKKTPRQVKIHTGNQVVIWDIRYVGDNYYCTDWQNDMLKRKVFNPNGFYCLDDENYFFSLVYHALIHKYEIAKDYYDKAQLLFDRLQLEKPIGDHAFPSDFDIYFNLLRSFMERKGYYFVKPSSSGVKYNKIVIASIKIAEQLTERYGLTDVEPIKVNQYQKAGKLAKKYIKKDCNVYFQGFLHGKKAFIKTNGYAETKKSEFLCSLKCFQKNSRNFLEPLFYYDSKGFRCVATEYVEGETLDVLLNEHRLSHSEKKNIILQLKDIAQTLCDTRVAHRDLMAHNLLVTPEGHVKLFDFGWSVEIDNYKECRTIRKNPLLFGNVCRQRTTSWLCSDDIYCLLNILKSIGSEKEYEDNYRSVETYLKNLVGRNAVKFKHPYSFIFHRYRRKLLKMTLFVAKNLSPTPALRTKIRHWFDKKLHYID